ncbi:hypothetical protein [Halorubrum sp. SY-15]|uniref:hypothetical protein n=1 Tax=Halorubrum sp. SY-15 TaxID=3402277 RepID=UPI003EBCC5D7
MTPDSTTHRTKPTTRQTDAPNARGEAPTHRTSPTTPTGATALDGPDATVERLVPMAPAGRGPRPDPTTLPTSRRD